MALMLIFPEEVQINGWFAPIMFFVYPVLWLTAANHATFYNLWGVDFSLWVTKMTILTAGLSDQSLAWTIFLTWLLLPVFNQIVLWGQIILLPFTFIKLYKDETILGPFAYL